MPNIVPVTVESLPSEIADVHIVNTVNELAEIVNALQTAVLALQTA